MNGGDPDDPKTEDPASTYARAISVAGADAVHEAIAKRGMHVLTRGLPYLLWASRHTQADSWRRDERRRSLSHRSEPSPEDTRFELDPYSRVARDESLARLLNALAEFEEDDALAIWWHFEGSSDEEIRSRLVERSGATDPPSTVTIRKRRERVLERLRRSVASAPGEEVD